MKIKKLLSNKPPKGTSDWLPEEFIVRKIIFDRWRKVCERFGFQEYLTPLVELADVYRAKSGEDVGGKELVTFKDLGGRELSIRPEMTPSVTRMVSKIYDSAQKPIRFFSIANFMRNEKPQRGRNREFWQLNFDVFGSKDINADIEVLQVALEIMLEFDPPKKSFVLYLNNRKLIDFVLKDVPKTKKVEAVRIMDKWDKLTKVGFRTRLLKAGIKNGEITKITNFMQAKNIDDLVKKFPTINKTQGFIETKKAISVLKKLGYEDLVELKPSVIRGFDYYDGIIFEVFDKHPKNKRAMFGGGRYNGLAELFGKEPFPAVGCAPGDETTYLFLESWGLLKDLVKEQKRETLFFPILSEELEDKARRVARKLRKKNMNIELGMTVQKMKKALSYADKKGIEKVIIFGEDEAERGVYKVKNMETGRQEEFAV